MIILLFVIFVICLFLGVPVVFSLIFSSLVYLLLNDISLVVAAQKIYVGMDVFVLLSIPGFLLAGNLMSKGGMTDKIINFSNATVGYIKGGLGLANIVASMIFAGISGTAIADVSSLGNVLIPGMKKKGYEADFSVGVTVASSTIGPIIPPSLPMIIVGTLSGLSVGRLFVAGAIPGVLLGLGLMVVSYIISVKRNHPKLPWVGIKEICIEFYYAFWALLMTFIILFGIVGGVFTPSEASVVASLYALVVGLFIYKQLSFAHFLEAMMETALATCSILFLVGAANLFAWILTIEQIPVYITTLLQSMTSNKIIILLLMNAFLLFIGAFMETIAALLVFFPSLLSVAVLVGVDPIHFAMIVVLNLMIGLTTPPVGVCLFVGASIGKISLWQATKGVFPFFIVSVIVLLIVTFVPAISLWLPSLLYS